MSITRGGLIRFCRLAPQSPSCSKPIQRMFHRTLFFKRFPAFWCAITLLATIARAELPAARLVSIFPPGAKQGSSVEVTLSGQDLDDVTALHFSDPHITA